MQRGDKFADVHPDEVENFSLYGWAIVADEPKPERRKRKAQADEPDEAE